VNFFCGKNSPFGYIKKLQATSLMELIEKNTKKSPNFEEESYEDFWQIWGDF
jgi:hypothetical protein